MRVDSKSPATQFETLVYEK